MRTRINPTSIAYSWMIALGFLGVIAVLSQPPARPAQLPSIIELPGQILSAEQSNLDYLKASAWCALEPSQVAVLKAANEEMQFKGGMAIAPQWRGKSLAGEQQSRLENCIALRIEQISGNRDIPGSERAALTFLFSHQ